MVQRFIIRKPIKLAIYFSTVQCHCPCCCCLTKTYEKTDLRLHFCTSNPCQLPACCIQVLCISQIGFVLMPIIPMRLCQNEQGEGQRTLFLPATWHWLVHLLFLW